MSTTFTIQGIAITPEDINNIYTGFSPHTNEDDDFWFCLEQLGVDPTQPMGTDADNLKLEWATQFLGFEDSNEDDGEDWLRNMEGRGHYEGPHYWP